MLDYVEFLESRFGERGSAQGNAFTRFTEAVEDRLRAGKVSATAIAETMGLLNRAANVLSGAVAAGKSVATDLVSVAQEATRGVSSTGGPTATPVPPVPPVTPAAPATPPPAAKSDASGAGG